MMPRTIRFKKLHPNAKAPERKTEFAAGYDLCVVEGGVLIFGEKPLRLRMGLAVEIPEGFEGQVRLRSGLGGEGLYIPNAPGTIDSDFRGEMCLQVATGNREHREGERVVGNVGDVLTYQNIVPNGYVIRPGDRVAQLVITRVESIEWIEAEELSNTDRGNGGWGSTGKQ